MTMKFEHITLRLENEASIATILQNVNKMKDSSQSVYQLG